MQRTTLAMLCVSLFAVAAVPALAGTTGGSTTTTQQQTTKLIGTYTNLAGSSANAGSLVNGLRNGSTITLMDTVTNADGTTSSQTTTFQPATGKMGDGNVNIALSLAKQELTAKGITDPTASELEAALNGGSVTLADGTSVNLQGVLALRAAGQGWGEIAHTLGFKLGDLVSASKTTHTQAGMDHGSTAADHASNDHGRPQHATDQVAQVSHPMRPDHVDRPQRPERPQLPERPERPTHVGRPVH